MRARIIFLSAFVLVVTTAGPAAAKGAYEVTLTGGGQDVTYTGNGELHTNTTLSNFAASVELYGGLWEEGKRIAAPQGDLGPRITAAWMFIGPAGDVPVVQYLYPFAAGGPVSHIPGGQHLFDDVVVDAWFPIADDVVADLASLGFDATALGSGPAGPAPARVDTAPPAALEPAVEDAARPSVPAPAVVEAVSPVAGGDASPAATSSSISRVVILSVGAAVALWAIMGRRRMRRLA
ncbi:MAG: hypothetical protein ACE5GC_00665 [Acidimicrobiia bacterium]